MSDRLYHRDLGYVDLDIWLVDPFEAEGWYWRLSRDGQAVNGGVARSRPDARTRALDALTRAASAYCLEAAARAWRDRVTGEAYSGKVIRSSLDG